MPEPETTLTFFHLHRLCLGKQSQSLDDDEGVGNVWQRRLFHVQGRNGRERGMARGGTGFGCSIFLLQKTELSAFTLKLGPPLCCFSVAWPLCFLSLFPVPPLLVFQPSPLFKNSPPCFSFPAFSPFQKLSPPFKNSPPPFAAASKGSGAAACAWGAGDTKPGQPALLPTPEGLGQRHAHGVNGVYTILGFFFFSFFSFYFLFLWGSKNGLQQYLSYKLKRKDRIDLTVFEILRFLYPFNKEK